MPILQALERKGKTGTSRQYTITLNRSVVDAMGWAKGDRLELVKVEGYGDALLLRRTFKARE